MDCHVALRPNNSVIPIWYVSIARLFSLGRADRSQVERAGGATSCSSGHLRSCWIVVLGNRIDRCVCAESSQSAGLSLLPALPEHTLKSVIISLPMRQSLIETLFSSIPFDIPPQVKEPSRQGYFKRFTASGGDIDSASPMKVGNRLHQRRPTMKTLLS